MAIGAAVAAVGVGAFAACGSQPVACGGCGCNGDATPQPTPFDVTFDLCQTGDAGALDASGDAAEDASDDAGDGGMCFATCDQACAALKPSTIAGSSVSCVSTTPDAGTGPMTAHCTTIVGACTGRKLDGLRAPPVGDCDDPIGAWFAQAAWLEAASVGAFRRLARELRAHGAPAHLIAAANAAARDEIRHARLMTRFANAHGAVVPRVEVDKLGVRDLESVVRENAVEGCVGETYGAAFSAWAAEHGQGSIFGHEDVRAASRAIASDEMRHAALGWAVHAWASEKLDREALARVRAARDEAVRAFGDDRLAVELQRELWAA